MRKISVLIIEDEELAQRRISKLLSQFGRFEVLQICDNGEDGLETIGKLKPDVIFLDIEMPKLNGIDLVKRLPFNAKPIIVFITAYNKYAVEAFEFFALDYLLKPFTIERFTTTINRIEKSLESKGMYSVSNQLNSFIDFIKDTDSGKNDLHDRIPITVGNKIYFIQTSEIKCVVASGNYVDIFAKNTKHVIRETLNSFHKKLDKKQFIRIHKSHLINVNFIKEIQKSKNGSLTVFLDEGQFFNVSKSYKKDFLERINIRTNGV